MKYQKFLPSGCKVIGIRIFVFVAETQFLFINCIRVKVVKFDEQGNRAVVNKIAV